MSSLTKDPVPENLPGLETENYLLHRPPMSLVVRLVAFSEEAAACEFRVSPANLFYVKGNGVPAYVGIEYMAQCIAVHAGVRAHLSGRPPPIGFLLGSRSLVLFDDYLVEKRVYTAECRQMLSGGDGMGSFDCKIVSEGHVIASARLAVLERHDEEAFRLQLS